uniref:Uncharacterized protein n=1 Tax=Opuntia streptacantha TaxID=393608 RepID=A0A7C9ATT5_OPUST
MSESNYLGETKSDTQVSGVPCSSLSAKKSPTHRPNILHSRFRSQSSLICLLMIQALLRVLSSLHALDRHSFFSNMDFFHGLRCIFFHITLTSIYCRHKRRQCLY